MPVFLANTAHCASSVKKIISALTPNFSFREPMPSEIKVGKEKCFLRNN